MSKVDHELKGKTSRVLHIVLLLGRESFHMVWKKVKQKYRLFDFPHIYRVETEYIGWYFCGNAHDTKVSAFETDVLFRALEQNT